MSPDQHEEINLLSKHGHTIDAVTIALTHLIEGVGGKKEENLIFEYYWPITLKKAFDFFKDEEEARNATMGFMDHWRVAILKWEQKSKLSPFYDNAVRNFFLNHQRVLDYGPEIHYGTETEDVDDDSDITEVVAYTEEYPFDGIDNNDPEALAIKKEEAFQLGDRVEGIRDSLFPGDRQVYDLLLENYNSDDIASILERSTKSVERAMSRIREASANT